MAESDAYITLTQENFEPEVLESDVPVLVDFWAEWCGPCRRLEPTIEALAEQFDETAKVGKLNVDDHPRLAQKYNVRSIPTVFFFKEGEVAHERVGLAPQEELEDKLTELVNGQAAAA